MPVGSLCEVLIQRLRGSQLGKAPGSRFRESNMDWRIRLPRKQMRPYASGQSNKGVELERADEFDELDCHALESAFLGEEQANKRQAMSIASLNLIA